MKGFIFVYLLSYGGSVAALFNPFIGLCIYYCFVVLRPQDLWVYSLPQGASFSRYVALAALVGWGLQGFSGGAGLRIVSPVLFAFAWFVLMVQISAWFALNSILAEPTASDLLKIFFMFLAGLCLVTSRLRLQALIWVFIISQGYLAHDINLTYFLEGINLIIMRDGFGPLNNNTFALSLLPGIGLALMTAIYERRMWLRAGAAYATAASLHVILLSESRGAYLGILAMGCIAAVLIPKNGKTILTFLLIVVLGMTLAGDSVRKEFETIFADKLDDSAASRPLVWSAAYQTMMDYPLLGVGPSNFGVVSANYGVEEGRAAHNLYLQVGADCGITGLTLLLLLYFRSLKAFFSLIHWRTEKMMAMDPVIASAVTGAFIGLIGYMVHSIFSAHVAIETPYLTMLIGAAALRCHVPYVTAEDRHENRTLEPVGRLCHLMMKILLLGSIVVANGVLVGFYRRYFPAPARTKLQHFVRSLFWLACCGFLIGLGGYVETRIGLWSKLERRWEQERRPPTESFTASGDPGLVLWSHAQSPQLPRPDLTDFSALHLWQMSLRNVLHRDLFKWSEITPAQTIARQVMSETMIEGGIKRTFLTYESFDGTRIPAYLLVPPLPSPLPAVIVLHGHLWRDDDEGISQTAGLLTPIKIGSD